MDSAIIATATEEHLISLCHQAEHEGGLIGDNHQEGEGDRIVKLSAHIAVKYGHGVTAAEAATQEFASNAVDPTIVHIPRVYRFIKPEPTPKSKDDSAHTNTNTKGYLFMEYIPGQNLKHVDIEAQALKDTIIPRIAAIAAHLGQIQAPQRQQQPPGPVGGGEPHGNLWGDHGAKTTFRSVEDLNVYMNKRLSLRGDSIDLAPYPLVLCHLDLCRRNIILKDDGVSLALVDWGSAGFYPRFFEIAMIPCVMPYDASFEGPLLQEVEKVVGLTDEEKRLSWLVRCVRAANLRYLFDGETSFDFAAFMASTSTAEETPRKEK